MFRHPKYYKELRKRNKPAGTGGALCVDPEAGSDQAISKESSTEENQRAPGPGHKLQAREDSTANSTRGPSDVRPDPGLKLPGPRPISNANKGLIHKPQASSAKPQAPSSDKKE